MSIKPTVVTSKVYPIKDILEISLNIKDIKYTAGTITNKDSDLNLEDGIITDPSLNLDIIYITTDAIDKYAKRRLVLN